MTDALRKALEKTLSICDMTDATLRAHNHVDSGSSLHLTMMEVADAARAALAEPDCRPLWTGKITGVDIDDSGRTWIACDGVIQITVNAEYSLTPSPPTGGVR